MKRRLPQRADAYLKVAYAGTGPHRSDSRSPHRRDSVHVSLRLRALFSKPQRRGRPHEHRTDPSGPLGAAGRRLTAFRVEHGDEQQSTSAASGTTRSRPQNASALGRRRTRACASRGACSDPQRKYHRAQHIPARVQRHGLLASSSSAGSGDVCAHRMADPAVGEKRLARPLGFRLRQACRLFPNRSRQDGLTRILVRDG